MLLFVDQISLCMNVNLCVNCNAAEQLGIPYLSAYLNSIKPNFEHGANFATRGATIRQQNEGWFQNYVSPFSLDIQLTQFDEFKAQTTYFYNQGHFHYLPFVSTIFVS